VQFQVPQNIDLKDKIVGPMTLEQFIYVLVGGMLDYIAFIIFDLSAFILIAIPITAFFLAMAFAKFQDQPFPKFLQNLIIFLFVPKTRTWNKESKPIKIVSRKIEKPKEPAIESKKIPQGEIDRLAQILDNRGWKREEKAEKLGTRLVSQDEAKQELNLKSSGK